MSKTDIVERLRAHLRVIDAYPEATRADDMAGFVQSVRAALDEIERLRSVNAALVEALVHLEASLADWDDAKVFDKARAALAKVENEPQ